MDTWAAEAARLNGLQVVEHLADWATHGRGAGFLRNTTLVEDSDKGVCFWDGSSHGSQDTANKFKKAGKPIEMIIVRTELA